MYSFFMLKNKKVCLSKYTYMKIMKFYRCKQVQRMTIFGFDDILLNDASLSKTSPPTTTGV